MRKGFVYILTNVNNNVLYTGVTNDLISSLLKNPIFVILSEAKDRISVGDSSAGGLRMTQSELFQQTANQKKVTQNF